MSNYQKSSTLAFGIVKLASDSTPGSEASLPITNYTLGLRLAAFSGAATSTTSGVISLTSSTLNALSALVTNGILAKTATGTVTTRSISISGTGLSITNADGVSGNPTITSNATNLNTVSTIVARDSSGNFSAGTITAALSGNSTTATTLATTRTIAISGDGTGTATSFNGSANITIPFTLSSSGVIAGTYRSVTVDAKGRVTAATNPTTLAGYGIIDAIPSSSKGVVNGVATLDATGKVTAAQLPLDGSAREAIRRSYKEAGYNLVDGSFDLGGTLQNSSDVLLHQLNGKAYSWGGTLPKSVAAGATPATSGGIGAGAWVDRTQETLRSDLAGSAGSNLIRFSHDILYSPATVGFRLKNTVYVTDTPFNAPTDGSDAASHINAALTYCAANNKDLVLDRLFTVGSTITIPSNVSVICLARQCGINSTAVGANKAVSITGINSKFIGGTIKGINNPASATIRQDGVFMTDASSFCELVDVHVYGFYAKGFTGDGTGVGISDGGVGNKITSCHAINSKFCVSLGGKKGKVVGSFISNYFLTQTVESKPWTSASNYWDGIVAENIEDYLIAFNTVTECGQSGIYSGGSGGLSKSNRIIGNLVEKCWNRGIDQGVNVAQSASNDVIGISIVGNICRNNRENNIWLAGTTRCSVVGNTSIYDAEYATLFAGNYGGHTGIALTNGAVGTVPHGNSITDNNCYDSESYSNISISCGVTATGNTINGNTAPQGYYLVNNAMYASNNFDFLKAPTFTPALIGGSGTVTLSDATGTTNIKGRRVSFNITIAVSSVSTPTGHLMIGYIPPLSGATLLFTDVKVSNYDGLDSTIGNSQLVAYISSGSSDQVHIARVSNGTRAYDVRAFLKAGSTITVSGEAEFYS